MDHATEACLRAGRPFFWTNPGRRPIEAVRAGLTVTLADIEAARDRLARFGPLLAELFPELAGCDGIVESGLRPVPALAAWLAREEGLPRTDTMLLKGDHLLPAAGSVKARGGFHAVLAVAERLALESGLLSGPEDDYRRLGEGAARRVFAGQTLSVGSTGNLGLSIGVMGRAFGFAVTVHMSSDAKPWKMERLRRLGATVVEHAGDYTAACAVARAEARRDPAVHFVDDENSRDLFLGYAVAGLRLPVQLAALGVTVSEAAPLCLHLPCGVGGAPGGIALGARLALGDAALSVFVEPAEAPGMLLGLATGRHADVAVADIGLSGRTLADGLAVARPSRFVGRLMEPVLDGVCTVADATLVRYVQAAWTEEGERLEPSAAAALAGPGLARAAGLPSLAGRPAAHVLWATGGGMLPDEEFDALLAAGNRP